MTSRSVREEWIRFRTAVDEASRSGKETNWAWFRLLEAYDALTPEEAVEVHAVLGSWMLSEDEGLRSDAAFLIGERLIVGLHPSVVESIKMVSQRKAPGFANEVECLRRVLRDLDSASSA